jgi:hypothetical protein
VVVVFVLGLGTLIIIGVVLYQKNVEHNQAERDASTTTLPKPRDVGFDLPSGMLAFDDLPAGTKDQNQSGFDGVGPFCGGQQMPTGIYGGMDAVAPFTLPNPDDAQPLDLWVLQEGVHVLDTPAEARDLYARATKILQSCSGKNWTSGNDPVFLRSDPAVPTVGDESHAYTFNVQTTGNHYMSEDLIARRGRTILVLMAGHKRFSAIDSADDLRGTIRQFGPLAMTKLANVSQ